MSTDLIDVSFLVLPPPTWQGTFLVTLAIATTLGYDAFKLAEVMYQYSGHRKLDQSETYD